MAEKNFWGWLNLGRDGQPIEGESGSGQQYFAAKEPSKSRFWSACYWAVDLSVCVLMLPLLIIRAVIEELDRSACRLLHWLDQKRG